MHNDFTNRSAQTTSVTVPKKGSAAGDPAVQPNPNQRPAIMAERLGPRFAVRVAWEAPIDPCCGPTQANGRILPPAVRWGGNDEFYWGSQLGKTL